MGLNIRDYQDKLRRGCYVITLDGMTSALDRTAGAGTIIVAGAHIPVASSVARVIVTWDEGTADVTNVRVGTVADPNAFFEAASITSTETTAYDTMTTTFNGAIHQQGTQILLTATHDVDSTIVKLFATVVLEPYLSV